MKKLICIFLGFILINSSFSQQKQVCKDYLEDGKKEFNKGINYYYNAIDLLVKSAQYRECRDEAFEELEKVIKAIGASKTKTYILISTSEYKSLKTSQNNNCKEVQLENDRLEKVIDSLRKEIALRDGQRNDRIESREVKDEVIILFKDPAFKALLLKICDHNKDGEISQNEAETVFNLDITKANLDFSGKKISSIDGIEYFVKLEHLTCSKNKLTKLDLTNNKALKTLICDNNVISSLDISSCQELITLNCANNKLSALNISNNKKIKFLNCSKNNLIRLTTSSNPLLEELNCSNNQILTLTIDDCRSLKKIECQKNTISTLDLTTNTNLTELNCSYNKLISLSVENNKLLKKLNCSYNLLNYLNVNNGSNFDLLSFLPNPNLLKIIIGHGQEINEKKIGKKTELIRE